MLLVRAKLAATLRGRNIFSDLTTPAARLKEWQRWPQISAVKTGSLFSISGDLLARATPRILQSGQRLCEDLESVRERHTAASDETLIRWRF